MLNFGGLTVCAAHTFSIFALLAGPGSHDSMPLPEWAGMS